MDSRLQCKIIGYVFACLWQSQTLILFERNGLDGTHPIITSDSIYPLVDNLPQLALKLQALLPGLPGREELQQEPTLAALFHALLPVTSIKEAVEVQRKHKNAVKTVYEKGWLRYQPMPESRDDLLTFASPLY